MYIYIYTSCLPLGEKGGAVPALGGITSEGVESPLFLLFSLLITIQFELDLFLACLVRLTSFSLISLDTPPPPRLSIIPFQKVVPCIYDDIKIFMYMYMYLYIYMFICIYIHVKLNVCIYIQYI
jgi:hypothetical protein